MQLMELAIINGTYGAQERQKAILQAAAAAAAQRKTTVFKKQITHPNLSINRCLN